MHWRSALLAGLISLSAATCGLADDFMVQTGELDGVLYTLAVPEDWNGKLLLQAHGSRSVDMPLLADLDMKDAANLALVKDGWLIAYSSYRRNGPIVTDAALDLLALRGHVADAFGEPELVLVEGWSMGAVVAAMLAEDHADLVDGVCGVGAMFSIPIPGEDVEFSRRPGVPVLLLSNMGEPKDAREYCVAAGAAGAPAAYWMIGRYGHVNLNSEERLVALRALEAWASGGEAPEQRELLVDMTHDSVARRADGVASAVVLSVHAAYGNVRTEFVPDDLAWLGVVQGGNCRVETPGASVVARYGKSHMDAKPGGWVIFPDAEGYLTIARNRARAVDMLGSEVDDTIRLSAAEPR